MGRTAMVWALRGLAVLGGWAVAAVTFLDPRWGAATAVMTAVFITLSALWVAKTSGPLHECPGRHVARHRHLEQEKAILARLAANSKRLEVHEQQLTSYEKAWSFLAEIVPDGWDPRPKRDLRLVRDDDGEQGAQRGRRAGLLARQAAVVARFLG